jgi:hypothetical protein
MWRSARREPWLAVTALVATLCALTVVAIRWLAVLGVVRDYAVARTSGSVPPAGGGWGYTTSSYHRQLGLISGPSLALTHIDSWTWRVGFFAGVFWVLRLGLRSANRRVGVLRGIGVVSGFGAFVATGVAHHIADAVIPSVHARDRMHRLITLWCFAAVLTAVLVGMTVSVGAASDSLTKLGDHAVRAPAVWSIARNAMQLLVVVGGWSLAWSLTRSWIKVDDLAFTPHVGDPSSIRATT